MIITICKNCNAYLKAEKSNGLLRYLHLHEGCTETEDKYFDLSCNKCKKCIGVKFKQICSTCFQDYEIDYSKSHKEIIKPFTQSRKYVRKTKCIKCGFNEYKHISIYFKECVYEIESDYYYDISKDYNIICNNCNCTLLIYKDEKNYNLAMLFIFNSKNKYFNISCTKCKIELGIQFKEICITCFEEINNENNIDKLMEIYEESCKYPKISTFCSNCMKSDFKIKNIYFKNAITYK